LDDFIAAGAVGFLFGIDVCLFLFNLGHPFTHSNPHRHVYMHSFSSANFNKDFRLTIKKLPPIHSPVLNFQVAGSIRKIENVVLPIHCIMPA